LGRGGITRPVPRNLGARAVKHDYDRAHTKVVIGIAGDIPDDARAVLDR